MKLIEIEPYFWELYQDESAMYLRIAIHNSFVTWDKSIYLDENAINHYFKEGKLSVDALAKRIESSIIRKDYDRFYSYQIVNKEQKQRMDGAFMAWKNTNQA
ncbi:hypothetical protein [Acinetobacter portensis]|uniref:hypothetical protein n=1 Tax=Acinetobacter portensis TaxID=1839785 RepID=UPI0013D5A4DE|nr:hypothetical protein [Acinetobacter portensis]